MGGAEAKGEAGYSSFSLDYIQDEAMHGMHNRPSSRYRARDATTLHSSFDRAQDAAQGACLGRLFGEDQLKDGEADGLGGIEATG
jgi:hypothetical protein